MNPSGRPDALTAHAAGPSGAPGVAAHGPGVGRPGPATQAVPPGPRDAADPLVARALFTQLELHGYHPVLVVGAASAGKSTLLASLLAWPQVDASDGIHVSIGPWDADTPFAQDDADRFFHVDVPRFIEGEAPPASEGQRGAVLPVVLTRRDGSPAGRFAFIEIPLVHAQETPGAAGHGADEHVAALLGGLPPAISVLYIAPCTHLDTWTAVDRCDRAHEPALRRAADAALAAFMDRYRALRAVAHRDDHLFVLAKWDAHAPPGPPGGPFFAPALDDVVAQAHGRWPRAFAQFQRLGSAGGDPARRQVMQYCAALMSGRTVLRADAATHEQLARYPRVLWSWLHANATRGSAAATPLFRSQRPRGAHWRATLDRHLARVLERIGV